jgi:hypothetical protein
MFHGVPGVPLVKMERFAGGATAAFVELHVKSITHN